MLEEQWSTLDATAGLVAPVCTYVWWVRDGFVAEQLGRIAWTERNRHLLSDPSR